MPVYNEYAEPPFASQYGNNLSTSLADWLTAHSDGQYRFQAISLPRKRLTALISRPGWQGLVAWANPRWFDDSGMTRYAWSQLVMQDADLVVSRQDKPIEYSELQHYTGLRLGGIAGQRYVDVDPLIASGQLLREDAYGQLQNLQKLRYGRIDVTFIMRSSLPYLLENNPDLQHWAYFSREDRGRLGRYFFAGKENAGLIDYINSKLKLLQQDKLWHELLKN